MESLGQPLSLLQLKITVALAERLRKGGFAGKASGKNYPESQQVCL
jgi:hypothetical protein